MYKFRKISAKIQAEKLTTTDSKEFLKHLTTFPHTKVLMRRYRACWELWH